MASKGKNIKHKAKKSRNQACSRDEFNLREKDNLLHFIPSKVLDLFLFRNESCFKFYWKRIQNTSLVKCATIVAEDFVFQEMDLLSLVNFQGWGNFCLMGCKYNEYLIKMFYANMDVELSGNDAENVVLRTTMFEEVIEIDVEKMCELLDVPNEGLRKFNFGRKNLEGEGVLSVEEQRSLISNGNIEPPTKMKVKNLDMNIKMVFTLVSRIIHPRAGNYGELTINDVFVISHLLAFKKLNLGYLVLCFMARTYELLRDSEQKVFLPYGHLISHILHKFKIPFPQAAELRNIDRSYTRASFSSLDMKDNGIRFSFGANRRARANKANAQMASSSRPMEIDDEEEQSEDLEDDQEDTVYKDPLEEMVKSFQDWQVKVDGRFDQFEKRFDDIEISQAQLTSYIQACFTQLGCTPPQPPQ